MPDPQIAEFIAQYQRYVTDVLKPTRDELKLLFRRWRQHEHWERFVPAGRLATPSPIQRAFARIKRPESVVDKIFRKADSFPSGLATESFTRMTDALGARVVVYFVSDLSLIDRQIRFPEFLELSDDHPPKAYLSEDTLATYQLGGFQHADKESGYSSIHYIVRLKNSVVPLPQRPWFEIQVRTLAQDLWSEIEHVLGYKPQKRTALSVTRQFSILGKQLAAIDEYFDFLYEELRRFQKESAFAPTDPLNAENLPAVLARVGLTCAQKEIDGLLRLLNSRGLRTTGAFLNVAVPERIQRIREIVKEIRQEEASDFEIVANLAAVAETHEAQQEERTVRAQVELLRVWDSIRK